MVDWLAKNATIESEQEYYLDNLCNSNRFTDCLSHGLQNNLFNSPFLIIYNNQKGNKSLVINKELKEN
jgi:hypothetical protein